MRVVLVTNGITSTLHGSLELARRLTEHGHDVVFLSHADVAETVESNGFRFVRLQADREAFEEIREGLGTIRHGSATAKLRAALRLPAAAWRARARTARGDELIAHVCCIDPDLLVIDIECHVAIIATARLAVPTVLTTFLFAIESRPGVPPIDSWLLPEHPGIDEAWAAVRRQNASTRWQRRRSRLALVDRLGPVSYATMSRDALRAVARRSGFAFTESTDTGQWLRPHGYLHVPVLTTNLRELEFGEGASPQWHYVGPMVHTSRRDVRSVPDGERPWQAVIDRCCSDPGRRLVYCSLGSYWAADIRLLGGVVEVFARHPEWELVIGLGGRGDAARLGRLPENVMALSWAPQVEILAAADAAIVHGGNASLNECVVAGVPMLVCSTGHLDQNGVAARVGYHGVGRSCDGTTVDADEIEVLLSEVLSDSGMRAQVRRLADLAAQPQRRIAAVELLEQIGRVAGGVPEAPP
jgi:zeaxanthin glucosyltransferase